MRVLYGWTGVLSPTINRISDKIPEIPQLMDRLSLCIVYRLESLKDVEARTSRSISLGYLYKTSKSLRISNLSEFYGLIKWNIKKKLLLFAPIP